MTTPQDLLFVTLDVPSSRPVEQGDLSLALAGAELVDLLAAEAVTLDDDRIVPGLAPATGDRLLDDAAAALTRQAPYETVEDWLWRRGRGLASAYAAEREAQEHGGGSRHRWLRPRAERRAPVDSPARRHAAERWASREPVLVGFAAALGIPKGTPEEDADTAPDHAPDSTRDERPDDTPDSSPDNATDLPDDAVVTVLATVNGALTELEAVRQRRRIEDAAFDNVWRAP
ncbi:GPP34 family phosphoprotein [Streptomyces sp. NPDC047085]|uniref:GOLPH3/VPS74 family protein n=1 Tax=Streptomyces sp. NPDC047085 TaxID=3155140 RepID=UPI0033CB14CD